MSEQFVRISLESLATKVESLGFFGDARTWIQTVLKEFIWSKQVEVVESLAVNELTAVQACHGVGKSFIASRIVAWWLSTRPIGRAYAVTTAPTARQVEAILWREIKRAHAKGNLPGYITSGNSPQWKTDDGVEIGMGRKPADHDAHGFQGMHDDYMLVVVDEACGVPQTVWNAVAALATNENSRVLAIGNPDDPSTHFRKICQPNSDWHVIRIDALASPNMCRTEIDKLEPERAELLYRILREAGIRPSTEDIPNEVRVSLVSPRYVARAAREWGTDSALWASKVRGLFPENNEEAVIPLGWVEQAIVRWLDWKEAGFPLQKNVQGRHVVACDVARYGEDATCVAVRTQDAIRDIYRFRGLDTRVTADLLLCRDIRVDTSGREAKIPNWESSPHMQYVVDVIGVGAGVVDNLRHAFGDDNPYTPDVIGFNASQAVRDWDKIGSVKFNNQRSASWWVLRQLLDPSRPGGSTIMLPDDDEIRADLSTPKWVISETGNPPTIKVESKDDIRKRLGRSPDVGDAVVMAFVLDGLPTAGEDVPDTRVPSAERYKAAERRQRRERAARENAWNGGLEETELSESDF